MFLTIGRSIFGGARIDPTEEGEVRCFQGGDDDERMKIEDRKMENGEGSRRRLRALRPEVSSCSGVEVSRLQACRARDKHVIATSGTR